MRVGAVIASAALLLAGCSGAHSPATPESSRPSTPSLSSEPTDALSDSTAYFVVQVTGRARVSWSDGMGPAHVADVGSGIHRYGSDNWQAEQLSAITAVPLDEDSTATCTIETGTENRKKSRRADHATNPQGVALCYVSRIPYATSESGPGKPKLVRITATSTAGNAVSLTWAGNQFFNREDVHGPATIQKRTDGHVAIMVISRRADDEVSCDLKVQGRTADTHKVNGLGAIAVCHTTIA